MKLFLNRIRQGLILLNYITFRKLINYLALYVSYQLSKCKILIFRNVSPSFMSVEMANHCNLHCPECPVGTRKIQLTERQSFDFEMYRQLVDSQNKTLLHLILYFQGEPLLNKDLPRFIRYAHESRIYTSISTNGQLLNKKNARDIVASGLDRLIVSIDGVTQDTYASYRVGGTIEKAINAVKELVQCKEELNSATPRVEIQFLVLRSNEHQMEEMKQLARSLKVDALLFKSAQLYAFEKGHPLLTTIPKYARYALGKSGKYEIKSKLHNHCWRLWSGAVVNVRGELLPCCFDKASEHSFGNVKSQGVAYGWLGKEASGFRKRILQNRKQFEMCKNCSNK